MREIKFRAWDKNLFVMRFNASKVGSAIYWDNGESFAAFGDEYILMQFTGLVDKNGKEIYEGDIVIGPSDSSAILRTRAKNNKRTFPKFEVSFGKIGGEMFGFRLDCLNYDDFQRTFPLPKECEVIGNIYENPSLLDTQPKGEA